MHTFIGPDSDPRVVPWLDPCEDEIPGLMSEGIPENIFFKQILWKVVVSNGILTQSSNYFPFIQ